MTHTATPWSHNNERSADICGSDGKDIAIAISREMNTLVVPSGASTISAETRAEAHANAAFIVRACNAHDDLVKTLKAVKELLVGIGCTDYPVADEYDMVCAALAKATHE